MLTRFCHGCRSQTQPSQSLRRSFTPFESPLAATRNAVNRATHVIVGSKPTTLDPHNSRIRLGLEFSTITGTVAEYPAVSSDSGGSESAVHFRWQVYLHLREFPAQNVVLDMTPGRLNGTAGVLIIRTQNTLQVTGEDRNLLTCEVAVLGSSQVPSRGWLTR